MSSCRSVISRVLPIALLSLGLAFASPVAAMTSDERCVWKADRLEARYTKCLARAEASIGNMLDGSTLEDDLSCASRLTRRMDFLERWSGRKDLGAECTDRLSEAARNGAQAAILVGAGRDLSDYPHLSWADLAGSGIGNILDQIYDEGYDDGEASVDVASNDAEIAAAAAQAACEDANGTWESGTCTAGSSYNCTIASMCSAWAADASPFELEHYTNNYVGHTAGTAGCPIAEWNYTRTWAQVYSHGWPGQSLYPPPYSNERQRICL